MKDHATEDMQEEEAIMLDNSLWWMRGRREIIRHYMRKLPYGGEIVDIGCGSGGNTITLKEFGGVCGVEPSETLRQRARKNTGLDIYESLEDLPHLVDIVTCFDVLEHINDDLYFLQGIALQLNEPHSILVSVPAMPSMWSRHDELLHHYRRYDKETLAWTLEGAGYRVKEMRYHCSLLLPLAYAARIKEKILPSDSVQLADAPPLISNFLEWVLWKELQLPPLPAGLWLFAIGEKNT